MQCNFLNKISFDNRSRVLDIGCGDGLITNEIATIVHDDCVIGTDLSEQMIEFASKKYVNQDNLRFVQMNASKIFLENNLI